MLDVRLTVLSNGDDGDGGGGNDDDDDDHHHPCSWVKAVKQQRSCVSCEGRRGARS